MTTTESPSRPAKQNRSSDSLLRTVASPLASLKVHDSHRDRLAVVYVRQSTPQQTIEHQESLRRQYGLTDYALALGWASDRILVIDDDLGLSGRTMEGRLGFQRLLTEVTMDHVGIVIGLEMSRLARSSKDWHGSSAESVGRNG